MGLITVAEVVAALANLAPDHRDSLLGPDDDEETPVRARPD